MCSHWQFHCWFRTGRMSWWFNMGSEDREWRGLSGYTLVFSLPSALEKHLQLLLGDLGAATWKICTGLRREEP